MRRYLRSYRTRKNIRRTDGLRDQFIRQLTREAEALMQQWNAQFSQNLQAQMSKALQGIVAGDGAEPLGSSSGRAEPGSLASFGQLLATGVRVLVRRPRTTRDSRETERSIDAQSAFRLSRSQAMAEAQEAITRGDRNG